jgi:K+-sensing histidine kinase KdpD
VDQAEQAYFMLTAGDEIRYANEQARRYLGLTQDDRQPITGKFLELASRYFQCHPKEIWQKWPQTLPSDPELNRYLVRPESPTTDMLWLRVDLLAMESEQDAVFLVRLEDVTAMVVEERFRWSFQAQISHKLKTPLMQLISSVELLMDNQATLSEADKASFLQIIYRGCLQLQEAMRGVFQYIDTANIAKTGHGPCSLTEIAGLIADMEERLELNPPIITFAGIEHPEHVSISIADRAIELIIRELLWNAKKFHPQQSPTLEIRFCRTAESILIQICDDGVTLSSEQLVQMWYPYYQVEKFFTGQIPGMGLGLSVVAALIWSVGGNCRAYNRPDGPGVVIELVLPQEREAGQHE